jgi:hypothetical protein
LVLNGPDFELAEGASSLSLKPSEEADEIEVVVLTRLCHCFITDSLHTDHTKFQAIHLAHLPCRDIVLWWQAKLHQVLQRAINKRRAGVYQHGSQPASYSPDTNRSQNPDTVMPEKSS